MEKSGCEQEPRRRQEWGLGQGVIMGLGQEVAHGELSVEAPVGSRMGRAWWESSGGEQEAEVSWRQGRGTALGLGVPPLRPEL